MGQQTFAVTPFADIRAQALAAFGQDPSYAVSMARQANTILNKRDVWKYRTELRKAEKKARKLCTEAGAFICQATTPCGTGQCKFAEGDLTLLEVDDSSGSTERPKPSNAGPYDLEAALPALRELRLSA